MSRPLLKRVHWLAVALTLCGAATFLAGALRGNPSAWSNLLVAGLYLAGLGLGGVFLAAVLELGCARWNESLGDLPVALTWLFVPAIVILVAVFVFAPGLYAWHELASGDGWRAAWLSRPAFLLRSAVYLSSWVGCAAWLVRGDRPWPGRAAACLAICGTTVWLAAYDWLVLLTPHWGSTIYGVYVFGGFFASAIAAVSLLAVAARLIGYRSVAATPQQRHDLGQLLFAFATFWAYLWFCQFMLIWYTNLPEETRYFETRLVNGWSAPFWATVVLGWALPFALLLSAAGKRSPWILAIAACSVLAGHWLDLDVIVNAAVAPARGLPGVTEAGIAAGMAGVALLGLEWRLRIGLERRKLAPPTGV